jgi:lipoprotein-anchoring transpeptidase ErfK/SrfK
VTDLATRDETQENEVVGAPESAPETPTPPSDGGTPAYEWAAAQPAPRKRHLGWWIGGASAVVVAGLVVSSLVLIAPGTSVGTVPVGFLTEGAATDAIRERLASTTIELDTPDGAVTVTGAQLGATVDAQALGTDAFSQRPMWNVGAWFAPPIDAPVTIDRTAAAAALAKALPSVYQDAVDAQIVFDPASAAYAVTPAVDGTGLDLDAVEAALNTAFGTGSGSALAATAIPVAAPFTTDAAQQFAGTLNAMLDNAGFYVGEERTVPLDRATLASWLTVTVTDDTPSVTVDEPAVAAFVETLPSLVNRAPVDATVIVNSSGTVLRDEAPGMTGRSLDSTAGIADAYATQLAQGNGVYPLTVTETAFQSTKLERLLEVNLSEQRLYLKENGNVVDSWLISSGASATPTTPGRYRINSHLVSQTMRGRNADGSTYTTPNVKWVMYFNGDQGFHGVYWHRNWGHTMSHGCVGMSEDLAKRIYDWAPNGVDVWIHS